MGSAFSAPRLPRYFDPSHDPDKGQRALAILKSCAVHSTVWAVLLAVLRKAITRGLPPFSATLRSLSPIIRHALALDILSLLNALVTTAYALRRLLPIAPSYKSVKPSEDGRLLDIRILNFMLGYFIHDAVATRRDWAKRPAFILHHTIAVLLIPAAVYLAHSGAFPSVFQLAPRILVLESSTIFLQMMAVFGRIGMEGSLAYKACGYAFAGLFLLLRVGWFGWVLHDLETKNEEYGRLRSAMKMTFRAAYGLQLHWARKIIIHLIWTGRGESVNQ